VNSRRIEGSEYEELLPNDDLDKRREHWEIAKGLQKADGLTTSKYLETVIADTLSGKYSTTQASSRINSYYEQLPPDAIDTGTEEADKVAARITAFLETGGFKFSPVELRLIHKDLFQDFPQYYPGTYRTINIAKKERVLGGASVEYAAWERIPDFLAYDFDQEASRRYSLPFTTEQVASIVNFTSRVWETHPFHEGNTRSVSTFIIRYLRNMGVQINNGPFKDHVDWFRDALVRANYSNAEEDVMPDATFITLFFENILLNANHDLSSYDLIVPRAQAEG